MDSDPPSMVWFEDRLTRFENRIEDRLNKIEEKIDSRFQWEKEIEIRLTALEGGYKLAVWVLGTIVSILILGAMSLIWSLITGQIRLVP